MDKTYIFINAYNIEYDFEFSADQFILFLSHLISEYNVRDILRSYCYESYYFYWNHQGYEYIDIVISYNKKYNSKVLEIKNLNNTSNWILNFKEER